MDFMLKINVPSRSFAAFTFAGTAAAAAHTTMQPTKLGLASITGVAVEVLQNMMLEITVLVFILLGFALLRLDKVTRKRSLWRTSGGAPAIAAKLKAVRLDFQNTPDKVCEVFRTQIASAGFKECVTLDVLRIVMQCALQGANWEADVRDVAKYLACFPDPLGAMPHAWDETTRKKVHMGVKTVEQGRTVVLNQILRVAVRADRPLDQVYTLIQEHFAAAATEETYDILLGGYAAAGDETRVVQLLDQLRAEFKGAAPAPRAFTSVVVGFLKAQKLPAARTYLEEMQRLGQSLPSYALVDLAKAVASAEGASKALDELLAAAGAEPLPAEAWTPLLEEAAKAGEASFVTTRVVELLREQGTALTYHGCEAMMKVLAAAASPLAMEYFEHMREAFHLSEGTCVSVLCACAESKYHKLAERIVEHRRGPPLAMTLPIYSALMKVYASAKLYGKCCDLYPQLIEDGIEPDDVMRGCLMNFAARAGRTELGEQLFAQGGKPARVVQNYMSQIRACRSSAARGGVERALGLLQQLRDQGLEDQTAGNSVLDVCVIAQDLDRAKSLYEELTENYGYDAVACNTLLKGYCGAARIEDALALLRSVKAAGHTPSDVAYNCLLNAHVRARDFGAAWSWYEEMGRDGVAEDVYTVSTLVKGLKSCHDQSFCRNVLRMLDSTAVDVTSDEIVLTVVLDALVRLKDYKRLHTIVRKVKTMKSFPPVATINTIIKAMSSLKRIDDVMELWHELTEVRALEPNEISLGCVVDACVSNGRVEEALALVQAWKTRVPANTIIYSTLIKGCSLNRDAEKALALFDEMRAEGVAANLVTLNTVIDACARGGRLAAAAEVLELATEMGLEPDRITYSTLVKGFCLAGEIDQGLAVMKSAEKRGLAADVFMYNTVMDHCTNTGRLDQVDKLYKEMLARNCSPTNFTLGVMVKRFGRDNKLDKAFEMVDTLPPKYGFKPNTQEMTCLISACLMNKQLPRALQVYKRMQAYGPGPDGVTYERLITGLLRAGKVQEACEILRDAYGLTSTSGRSSPMSRSGAVTPGGTARGAVDAKVLESVVDALRAEKKTESVAIPLMQDLRAAGAQIPGHLLAGAVNSVAGSRPVTKAPWAKRHGA